ncbi:hemin transporter [Cupriavidus sp. USMAA2-4]|uniref:hemin uptake protein HemP n=1 Tax=unclassified Cupriavidus TaxID=2640874 RepID=UPI0008A695C6|nr:MULTISPECIES: hemin uptake protein HemP [unclassified Cupriavidus]AOY93396.1 hemin transporter [Cupriavidus sp. USMAA2-4]AOZ01347.1 hemin transporter [Cupriavidus sp. USMAHM13]
MSTFALPLPQPREVTRRRLSLRRVEVNPAQPRRETPAAAAIETVKCAVAALPARLEALVRDSRPAAPATGEPVRLDTLMRGASTLPILHNGEVYTLRITRYGKLILTK